MVFYFFYYLGLILTSKSLPNLGRKKLFFTYIKLKGKHLLWELFFRRRIVGENLFGFKLECINYSAFISMFEEIFICQVYFFLSRSRTPIIVDCGSNIGLSILFFKIVYPKAQIIAFEPDLRAFSTLSNNVSNNNFKGIKLLNKAVNNKRGESDFYFDSNKPGSLSMSLSSRGGQSVRKVSAVLLSSYIGKRVDFLKMDIEGAETFVVKELFSSGKLYRVSETVIEYHHHIETDKDTLSEILKFLEVENFGYQLRGQFRTPFLKKSFQDVLIYAYQK